MPRFTPLIFLLLVVPCVNGAEKQSGETKAADQSATRKVWTSSRLVGSPDPPLPFRVQQVFPRIKLSSPVAIRDLPKRDAGGSAYRIVVEQRGRIVTFASKDDPESVDVALDMQAAVADPAGEKIASVRDLAIDPDFENNGFLYVVWVISPQQIEGGTRVTRFTLDSQSPPKIDPASRLDIISYPSGDHIGASLRLGPDGMLWITSGDGSRPFPPDQFKAAQDVTDLRGSVLRIDVRGATQDSPYRIPVDNPFVDFTTLDGMPARGEIYAIGIRNGFRSAFDPGTNDFIVADVGWGLSEMVHRIVKGGNHGWSIKEGPHDVSPDQTPGPGLNANGQTILPMITMTHDEAQSITGGVFVEPDASINLQADFADHYLFGCYMNGSLWAADISDLGNPKVTKIAATGLRIIDFFHTRLDDTPEGQSEILILDINAGGVFRLEPNPEQQNSQPFPAKLSDSGLFKDLSTLSPADGVIAYSPSATMYRDGSIGSRVIGIPADSPVRPSNWFPATKYPPGTAFANTLSRDVIADDGSPQRRRIETQILLFDGLKWDPYTYRWNDEQTDADLVPAGGTQIKFNVPDPLLGSDTKPGVREMSYVFASRSQCMTCHHGYNPGGIGFTPQAMHEENKSHPRSGHVEGNSVLHWSDLVERGVATKLQFGKQARWVDPYDESYDLESRARSYLAVNCSSCHANGGRASSAVNLMRQRSLEETNIVGVAPSQGDFGITDAKIVDPGHPETSVLIYRVATHGPGQMPKLGAGQPDIEGVKLLWEWIATMEPSQSQNTEMSPLSESLIAWRRIVDQGPAAGQAMAKSVSASTTDPTIVGLFEPWLEPSLRASRVGANPDVAKLLAIPGDAKRGEAWFAGAASAQCRSCHRVRDNIPSVGPNLAGIGSQRTRPELLDQLLNPSAKIDPQWRSLLVMTIDGDLVTGLMVSETEDEITLRSPDGRDHAIAKDDIESQKTLDVSLMPAGLCETMTPTELADLLAYLQSL